MFSTALSKGFDKRRLRVLLALFFFALSIPTAFLIWQAYSQLKWEAFHQYRGTAEELTGRIDASLIEMIAKTEARSFADYTFLVVTGDPSAKFLQRSPLSAFPVPGDLPGLLGYFQVGADGEFSTPLLPQRSNAPASFGIPKDEYDKRQALAAELQAVLSDNRLVEYRPADAGRDREVMAGMLDAPAVGIENEEASPTATQRGRLIAPKPSRPYSQAQGEVSAYAGADADAAPDAKLTKSKAVNSQRAFDELKETRQRADRGSTGPTDSDAAPAEAAATRKRDNKLGRVADLKLDAAYQKKSAGLEQAQRRLKDNSRSQSPQRVTRKEQISVPEPTIQVAGKRVDKLDERSDVRISTFESEIDPVEFSLLDSGHLVLFRKVWRDGERYIQGMLVDQRAFIAASVDRRFRETALAAMSDLIVAYQDDVLHTVTGGHYDRFASSARELDGALLYRSRLSAPLDSLELIYSINRLPPGPGAEVLGWVTLVLGLVFCGGFAAMYRMGLSQISLAEQQQDFVSAVSHELKTPLTSIRMYGEMLKEGWADEEKKQLYYEFIHDESERLTRLISNVLQLANITRNEPQLEMKPIAVGKIMAAIESKIANQVQRAGFELVFQGDPHAEPAVVNIDQDCFAQIVINLVDNAIKFSLRAQRKRIEISARLTSNGKVVFSVRDFGPGIPKDQMRKIFEMFYRSESELTRETVGTGIGLAIVHQLSVAMTAKVDVMNRDPGAEFLVSFTKA